MYTSGTTGLPKGAIITHGMTFWNCVNLGGPAYISPSSVLLTVLPLFHTGGLNCYTNPVLHAGGTVLIMRAFDPGAALQLINDPARGINQFFGVPSIYQFMAQHPAFATCDFSRLVIGGVGGAPMPVPLLKVWEERGVALQQGYGMTETSPAVLTLDKEDAARKAGSSGKPVLHTEVRIVRPDGTDADVGELGELWVKGPNVTPGYWNRPEANASSFTDGWLHTGDATRVDEEGFYYIVDRWKDMYISGGENVYPAEVESVLHQLTAIAEAAIIGVPNEQWGEVGMAIVAVKPGHTLTPAEIHAHCAANLARFKCPRLIEFVDALPRNATGKIHKPTLRKNFERRRRPTRLLRRWVERSETHHRNRRQHGFRCALPQAGSSAPVRNCARDGKKKKPAGSSPAGLIVQKPIRGSQYIRGDPPSIDLNRREGFPRWSCRACCRPSLRTRSSDLR